MIRITKQADYAIILLGQFANDHSQATYNARDLALATRLPLPMVGKILKTLVRQKLLESHRGVKGGYALTRRPEDVSVADIISAMEGPIGLTECSVHGDCEYETFCPARSNWNKINAAVLKALRSISLAEMAHSGPIFLPVKNGFEAVSGPDREEKNPGTLPPSLLKTGATLIEEIR